MPTIVKKTKRTAQTKKAAKKVSTKYSTTAKQQSSPAKRSTNGFHPGTYIVPKGHVSIAVPTFWTLRQTNDDLQVESEASETTVIVTAYQRNADFQALDARDYLKHFLDTAPVAGGLKRGDSTKKIASARFRDEEGDNWLVRFISNGQTLLLATCHCNRPLTSRDGKTGLAVLDSIKLKARG